MKHSTLTIGLLSVLLGPASFAQDTPCGAIAPDPAAALTDQAGKQEFVADGRRYLQAAAYNIQHSDNPLCLAEVQRVTEPLNSPAFVNSLSLTEQDAKDLHKVLKIIRDGAAKQRKQAEQDSLAGKQIASAKDAVASATTQTPAAKNSDDKANKARAVEDSADGAVTALAKAIGDGARYSIYSGPAYSLKPDGSWSNGFDTVFRSETALKDVFRGYFQLSYTTRGGPEATDGTTTGSGEATPTFVSPFNAKGGIVNIQTGGSWMPFPGKYDWIGVSLRGGYESLPTEDDSGGSNTFKPFASTGLVTRTIYTDQQSLGQIFLGYSRDYRWDKDLTGESKNRYDRVVFSGLLELFQVSKATIATRLFASMPATGKGDTEFRISLLVGFKLDDIAQTLGSP